MTIGLFLLLSAFAVSGSQALPYRFHSGGRVPRRGRPQRLVAQPRAPGFLEPHLGVEVRSPLQLLLMASPPYAARRARSGSSDSIGSSR